MHAEQVFMLYFHTILAAYNYHAFINFCFSTFTLLFLVKFICGIGLAFLLHGRAVRSRVRSCRFVLQNLRVSSIMTAIARITVCRWVPDLLVDLLLNSHMLYYNFCYSKASSILYSTAAPMDNPVFGAQEWNGTLSTRSSQKL